MLVAAKKADIEKAYSLFCKKQTSFRMLKDALKRQENLGLLGDAPKDSLGRHIGNKVGSMYRFLEADMDRYF